HFMTTTISYASIFFFYCYCYHRHLHSFPTRRSSDLPAQVVVERVDGIFRTVEPVAAPLREIAGGDEGKVAVAIADVRDADALLRSEEHTSELQSRGQLVCRLLLEKKKIENTRKTVAS